MRIPSRLYRNRHGIWYYRWVVPKLLRPSIGSSEIRLSLGTREPANARLAAVAITFNIELVISQCGGLMARDKVFFKDVLLRGVDVAKGTAEEILIENASDEQQANAALDGVYRFLKGDSLGTHTRVSSGSESAILLSELLQVFAAEKQKLNRSPSLIKAATTAISLLIEILGDKPIDRVTKTDARHFKEVFLKLPKQVTQKREKLFPGLSLMQIADACAGETQEAKNYDKYAKQLSSMFRWADDNGYDCSDPFLSTVTGAVGRPAKCDKAFSVADLTLIANAVQGEKSKWKWPVLLCMYSGARIREICQIYLDDITQVDGVDGVWLTNKRTDQSIKSGRPRFVPFHYAIKDDFLAFVSGRQGSGRLFPEFKSFDPTSGYSRPVSRWFNGRFLPDLGISKDRSFHSFRHAFSNWHQENGTPEHLTAAVLGHANRNITYGVYGKPQLAPAILSRTVNKYPNWSVQL